MKAITVKEWHLLICWFPPGHAGEAGEAGEGGEEKGEGEKKSDVDEKAEGDETSEGSKTEAERVSAFIDLLNEVFWKLFVRKPSSPAVAPVVNPGEWQT